MKFLIYSQLFQFDCLWLQRNMILISEFSLLNFRRLMFTPSKHPLMEYCGQTCFYCLILIYPISLSCSYYCYCYVLTPIMVRLSHQTAYLVFYCLSFAKNSKWCLENQSIQIWSLSNSSSRRLCFLLNCLAQNAAGNSNAFYLKFHCHIFRSFFIPHLSPEFYFLRLEICKKAIIHWDAISDLNQKHFYEDMAISL